MPDTGRRLLVAEPVRFVKLDERGTLSINQRLGRRIIWGGGDRIQRCVHLLWCPCLSELFRPGLN